MALRDSWIEKREAAQAGANGGRNMSQMHLARIGMVSEEMQYVAARERLEPEWVRSEVARGRAIIPANIHHRNLEPMGIGVAFHCKINANMAILQRLRRSTRSSRSFITPCITARTR